MRFTVIRFSYLISYKLTRARDTVPEVFVFNQVKSFIQKNEYIYIATLVYFLSFTTKSNCFI